MQNKAIVLLSGGLDSVVAVAMAREKFDVTFALTFDYGQKASAHEIRTARAVAKHFGFDSKVIGLPWLKEITSTSLVNKNFAVPTTTPEKVDVKARETAASVWVPARNLVFTSFAASFAEALSLDIIIAGFNAEEARTFPDNSNDFLNASNQLLKFSCKRPISLESPTISMIKIDIAKKFFELNIPTELFWTCYEGLEKMCGGCESCARTIRAFKAIDKWGDVKHRFI